MTRHDSHASSPVDGPECDVENGQETDADAGFYRIGAVSRITGIALATLRMWERRYQLVGPRRSAAGGRLYSREDIARLGLIHAAVQAGHAIGTVAKLSDDELRERLGRAETQRTVAEGAPIRLAVAGPELPGLVGNAEVLDPAVRVIATGCDVDDVQDALGDQRVDVLLVELPHLSPEHTDATVESIRRLDARLTIVVYGFTSQKFLRRLDALNSLSIRAPADIPQILRLCRLGAPPEAGTTAEAPEDVARDAPRYSEAQLKRLMTMVSAVRCECPQQLSVLLASLYAFERYTRECGEQAAADAPAHKALGDAGLRARRHLEEALSRLLTAEGISV
jgi:MerR family transcriptional regulator, light-induced transcriptional regulator